MRGSSMASSRWTTQVFTVFLAYFSISAFTLTMLAESEMRTA